MCQVGTYLAYLSFSETSQRRVQLWQAVYAREDGADAHRQTIHDELGSDRVPGLLVPQPGVRPARVSRDRWAVLYLWNVAGVFFTPNGILV